MVFVSWLCSCARVRTCAMSRKMWPYVLSERHFSLSALFCLVLSLLSHLFVCQGVDFLPSLLPASLFRAIRLSTQRSQGPHSAVSVLRCPFGRVTTVCVSSPTGWAVSIRSHMQQNEFSFTPPRPSGTFFSLTVDQ